METRQERQSVTTPTEHQPHPRTERLDPTQVHETRPELRAALAEAQAHRAEHSGLTSAGEPEWAAFERTAMLDATTALLIRHELPLNADEITKAVVAAEQAAKGHSDLSWKWATGCARYIAEVAIAARN